MYKIKQYKSNKNENKKETFYSRKKNSLKDFLEFNFNMKKIPNIMKHS